MEVRGQILEAATRLMAARGFEGMSLQSVADAVGVRKPSVLYHFPSKADLKRAVLEDVLARWNDVLPRLLMASAQTGLAKFDAVMNELVRFFLEDPDRGRLIVRELLDRPREMQDALRAQVRPWVDVVASYIRKGQASGQIRAEVAPETYVLHVASMTLSGLNAAHAYGAVLWPPDEEAPPARAARELVRIARTSLFEESYLLHQSAKHAEHRGVDDE